MTDREAKLRACPCPGTATPEVRALFEDAVTRAPLGAFSRAQRTNLLSFCQLTVTYNKLTAQPRLRADAVRRVNRMAHALRSLALTLGLKELERKATKGEENAVQVTADDMLSRIMTDESHPRFGLLGPRVVAVTDGRATDDTDE